MLGKKKGKFARIQSKPGTWKICCGYAKKSSVDEGVENILGKERYNGYMRKPILSELGIRNISEWNAKPSVIVEVLKEILQIIPNPEKNG
ncbi:uncharacterized protein LOC129984214 isoform X2 [Argiope bruennichi]|uniref:uncharacterized protein LOC129984214 isoform X2 n=1 Tax=Argiope bruennichi TaxID=94029 RepID=UPI002495407F|nr:uncharacterized protein LOC129984214 isoform X2 [Argiope bruennichi]